MTDSRPSLNQLNLVVRDMKASLTFYRRLGLEVPEVWQTHHAEVRLPNGVFLEFDSLEMAKTYNAGWRGPAVPSAKSVIGFGLQSREAVDDLYAELTAAGYAGLQAPFDTFWGARYAIVEDPDNNHVGLMSPIDRSRQSASPKL